MPCAMLSRISTSRGESGAKIGCASDPYTASSRNSLRTREATAGLAKTLSLMRYSPERTRRMMAIRSVGSMSFRTYAAAPALMALKSWSSSSLLARTMTPVCGSSRFSRWVVSMPFGEGSPRSMRTTSGVSSSTVASASRPVPASPTTSISPSSSRMLRTPRRKSVWPSTMTTRVFPPARRSPPLRRSSVLISVSTTLESSSLPCIGLLLRKPKQDSRAFPLARFDVQLRAHELSSLSHELQAEVLGRTGCHPHEVEPAAVVRDHERVALQADGDAAGGRVLPHVLEDFLEDAKDRCASRWAQPLIDAVDGHLGGDAVAVLQLPGAIRDGRGQPDVHDRGSQVGDQCAHLVEAVPEHVPQEGQLGVGGAVFGFDHAVEVLDLEDGVGQDLRGAVMDVLGHALALAFLGLDDAESHRGGG